MAEDLVDKIYQQADGPVEASIVNILETRSGLADSINFVQNPEAWGGIELLPNDVGKAIAILERNAVECIKCLEELVRLCKLMTLTPSETLSKPNPTP